MGRSIISAFHFLLWIGSPFGFSRDSTICLTRSMYLFTVRDESPAADIFSMNGFTDRLSTFANGRFLWREESTCRALIGSWPHSSGQWACACDSAVEKPLWSTGSCSRTCACDTFLVSRSVLEWPGGVWDVFGARAQGPLAEVPGHVISDNRTFPRTGY